MTVENAAFDRDLEAEVASLIVSALNLEVAADEIDPEAPLYGEGLGLDSIDILEIALVISKKYGLQIKAGDKVLYGKYSGTEVTIDGEQLLILRESDILAIVK